MSQPRGPEPSNPIAAIPAFKHLPAETLAKLQKHWTMRRFGAGEPIVNHLDASNDVFLIIEGQARVTIYSMGGKAVTFCDLGPGDMFGEVAAIDGAPRSASVEARTSCSVSSIPAAKFRADVLSEPAVAQALLLHLATKVRELTTRVYEFSVLPVGNRIDAEVLRLAKVAPRQGKSARIPAIPTHAEIANRTSTHREAVTRELNRLTRLGLLERSGRGLVVKDVDRLAAMVHEATGE